jgi:hypothetical protein
MAYASHVTRAGCDEPRADGAQLTEAARAIAQSRAAREVTAAFRAAGIRCVLLKGAALAHALGDEDTVRLSRDIDLLVAAAELPRARQSLEELGFEPALAHEVRPEPRFEHAEDWWRDEDATTVDLHVTIPGARAPAERVWEELTARAQPAVLTGLEVDVLDDVGLAFHIALHAAQHGYTEPRPARDLERLLERFDEATWREALRLARQLDAEAAFGVGLRLVDEGRRLAEELGVIDRRSVMNVLAEMAAPGTAGAIEALAQRRGARAKAALVARKFVPTPDFMRGVYPIARRGRAGLAIAYLMRQGQIVVRIGPGLRAWRAARAKAAAEERRGR